MIGRLTTRSRCISCLGGVAIAGTFLVAPAIPDVIVPPQRGDLVDTEVTDSVTFDSATGLFTYSYSVKNRNSAQQNIATFVLDTTAIVSDPTSPPGWSFDAITMLGWAATSFPPGYVDDGSGNLPESPDTIQPGQTLTGFSFKSPSPPGPVTFYAQGFVPIPAVTNDAEELAQAGYDPSLLDFTQNSESGTTNGPASKCGDGKVDHPDDPDCQSRSDDEEAGGVGSGRRDFSPDLLLREESENPVGGAVKGTRVAEYQVADVSGEEAGPYREGVSPRSRPFDDSDPEMQALMNEVYQNGGCARPGEPCEAAAKLLRGGGDRLARYLIVQFTESLAAGYPNRFTYLSLIAYTNSNEGFRFVASRVRAGPDLDLADYQNSARALAHTGHRDAIPEAVRLLEQETDLNVLSGAINTLWRVPIATGELDLKVVDRLLSINAGEIASCGRFCSQRALDGLFRLRDHFDLSELDDLEPANRRLPALWKEQ